nr:hypothetical protein [Cytophagales bacterium]
MGKINLGVQIDPNNNRKTNPSKSGEYPIYVMIKEGRKKERIPVNIKLDPIYFQIVEGKWVKSSHTNAVKMNAIIRKVKAAIENESLDRQFSGKTTSPRDLKDWYVRNYGGEAFLGKNVESTFLDFFKDHITKERKGRKYEFVLKKLELFNKPSSFSDMKRDYFVDFSNFLKHDEKHRVSLGSGRQYWGMMKSVYREWCRKLDVDYHEKYFDKISFPEKNKDKLSALSLEEINKIRQLKFDETDSGKTAERFRDIFIIMCWTSRLFSELENLTIEKNLVWTGEDGDEPVIIGIRRKTGVPFENGLFPKWVEELFWKHNPDRKKGLFFPGVDRFKSGVVFNRHLKDLSERIGLGFTMTTRTARRTFASTTGAAMPATRKKTIMGHTNINMQNTYVTKTSTPLYDDLKKGMLSE